MRNITLGIVIRFSLLLPWIWPGLTVGHRPVFAQTSDLKLGGAVQPLQLQEEAVSRSIDFVNPMVVQIETIGGNDAGAGTSTGTVVSADGLVLTAAYNLRHQPASIFLQAILEGEKKATRLVAEIVALDRSRNLCLLKAILSDTQTLIPVTPASEKSLRVGHTTIAIGKVHDAGAPSISVGILSAAGRIWGRAVQTDAKVSKTNYGGPLINLKGETIGVLVPLAPDDPSVEAGAQWYDSGIGFAIPLESYRQSVERLANGEDLSQGLLGVTLKGKDLHADVPVIEYCSPQSPASESGLLPGDTIISVDQKSVFSQAHIKQVLGVKYAGDQTELIVSRNGVLKTLVATLAKSIEPFQELAIGVVPDRSDIGKAKVGIVLPDSEAANAGLVTGDIISAIGVQPIQTWDDFQSELNQRSDGDTITVVVRNETEANSIAPTTRDVRLEPLSASLPIDTGAQSGDGKTEPPTADGDRVIEVKQIDITVAGFANRCTVFFPKGADGEAEAERRGEAAKKHAVLVWVAIPGTDVASDSKSTIAKFVQKTGRIVMVPQSIDNNRFNAEESEFIVKAVGRLKQKFSIDDRRISIGGESVAAAMGCLTAFLHRDTFAGLVMLDSLFPARLPKIETRPDQRLMILLATSPSFESKQRLMKMKTVIEDRKFPIHHRPVEVKTFADLLPQIGLWIDAVDRH